ncbi:PRMT5 arginine-N-methyltransferase-domain-containing protein [Gorgonomyces haynaldii]|nr:PRMT5 arginine-N-methyltransferase-domain-containing protein [Gorgonomyces haynaldii]
MFGLEILSIQDMDELLQESRDFDFPVSQIIHQNSTILAELKPSASLTLNDLLLHEHPQIQQFTGCISNWVDTESENSVLQKQSERLIQMQVQYSVHLGLERLVFELPLKITNYARIISQALDSVYYTKIVIRTRLDQWENWNKLRIMCGHHAKLGLALDLSGDLDDVGQWIAEPVKLIFLPTGLFLKNAKGFPVLSKKHQEFMRRLLLTQPDIVISSLNVPHQENMGLVHYKEYCQYLFSTLPKPDVIDRFASGYHDYLQAPLQPLMDNLESATYQVFEKDPIKYQQYEKAIYQALVDRAQDLTVVFVVGAGRGPLVDRAIRAAQDANRKIKLYALEKNPNAILTLRQRKLDDWRDSVQVYHCDMRFWNPPEQCDILVSELLGSFGDNELSPECLDGAQRLIKQGGISIPCDYTTFISPISSAKLYMNTLDFGDLKHTETPYVVKFRQIRELSKTKPIWKFEHPNNEPMMPLGHPHFNTHNTRYSSVLFDIEHDSLLHGIAGYFESTLYKNIIISIHPPTHSPGMFSWFPIFFPLRKPIHVFAGSQLQVNFWRCTDARKVWYEWNVIPIVNGKEVVGDASVVHNPQGRSSWIGLQ